MPDENNEALNQPAEEAVSETDTPSVEPKASEEVSETSPVEETEPELIKTENPDTQPKKGAEKRIRELNRKAKDAEAKATSLEDKLKEVTAGQTYGPPPQLPNSRPEPLFKPGEESLSAEELNQRLAQRDQQILRQAASMSYLQQQQSQNHQKIQQEAVEVVNLYPQLNPNNKERFDSDLSDSITEATESFIKSNPTGSVKAFVKKMMKPYEKAVNKAVSSQTKTIVKQAAETATRPNQVAKSEKNFGELSLKEMEEQLGIVN